MRRMLRRPWVSSSMISWSGSSSSSSKNCAGGPEMASRDELKRNAAEAALAYVKPGMVLGLGTGSTARHFLAGVGRLVASGMELKGVPTSLETAEEAKQLGIPLTSLEESFWLDLTVDGADEADPKLDLTMGMGGALFREKIVAAASKKFVVIVDDAKLVRRL